MQAVKVPNENNLN